MISTQKSMTRYAALLLALSLLLTSCGSKAAATTMRLKKSEGTVDVADREGKNVAVREDLDLYSGYQVDTQDESYAWIDLDRVKLTKMDQDSEIAITKEGKRLEIEVLSGSLFFNVTEPLEDDEAMNIRASTMLVGIRGTCGWVEASKEDGVMALYLLEGTAECSAGDNAAAVNAGQRAYLTEDGTIVVEEYPVTAVPAFIQAELMEDDGLNQKILDASGMDIQRAARSTVTLTMPVTAQEIAGCFTSGARTVIVEAGSSGNTLLVDAEIFVWEGLTLITGEGVHVVIDDSRGHTYIPLLITDGGCVKIQSDLTNNGDIYLRRRGSLEVNGSFVCSANSILEVGSLEGGNGGERVHAARGVAMYGHCTNYGTITGGVTLNGDESSLLALDGTVDAVTLNAGTVFHDGGAIGQLTQNGGTVSN